MKIALCLLVRNEYACLKIMLPRIQSELEKAKFDKIVAIDGGSTDGTQQILADYNIPVIAQSKRGRGQAFHEAFANVDVDAYVFYSPDGKEDEKDFSKFKPILEKGADIVIASRMCRGAVNEEDIHLFKWRKWANNAFNILANIFFRRSGPFITDSINGYRAITKNAVQKLKLSAQDYTIEYQMTIRAFKHRLNIVEFPTIEGQRVAGDTGAPSFQTGIKFIKRFLSELVGQD
jgi:glycosyltransferase involved in cell wall biosynthesis